MRELRRVRSVTLDVLEVLLACGETYGRAVSTATGIPHPAIYEALNRLDEYGWTTSYREPVNPRAPGKPPRRLYTLTSEGATAARALLARWRPSTQDSPEQAA
jgi:PadR family transcriptional regulator